MKFVLRVVRFATLLNEVLDKNEVCGLAALEAL